MSVRKFILSTIEQYYSNRSEIILNDNTEDTFSDFIENSQTLLIQAFIKDNTVYLHNEVQDHKDKSIIFYKNHACKLTQEDALKCIDIITLSSSVAVSFYQVLKQVYFPLLSNGNDLCSNKLYKNLLDLESILKIFTYGKGQDCTNVILSIEDELEYWKTMDKEKSSHKEREGAAVLCELFEDINEEMRRMQSNDLAEMREAAENIGGLLDDIWRTTVIIFPQDRMIHIFDIIGHVICTIIRKRSSDVNLWDVHDDSNKDTEILSVVSDSLKVIRTWTSACKSLTETYWVNYALHAWNGEPYVPSFCMNVQNRLEEVHDIRSVHCQLNKLLTHKERIELQTSLLLRPFQNINIWLCNGRNQAWDAAVSKFTTGLRPVETKIAEKLKPRLHGASTKQTLYEFMRYQTLIERPLVKQALNNELEMFVSSLITFLKTVQNQLDANEVDVKMHKPPEMSPMVHQIQWAKQMEAKVKEVLLCTEKHLKEFNNSTELSSIATILLKDLKTLYTQLHDEWSRELQAQVKNGTLQLSTEKPVVEFSGASKMLVVNFNERLVWVEAEWRAMNALNLPSPPVAVLDTLDSLTKALVHARALQQVASFHNTLGERMIPSTRTMMLQSALELSSLVKNQKAAYWDDMEQLANYTDKMKKIILKLESQNKYLTSQHLAIRNIVEKLMATELLSKQSEWKKGVKDIRNIIEKVETNGYKNTDTWRLHWDWQLYKALEYQYIKTLLCLHKHFPNYNIDLVLRGHMVRPQPPLEEIRAQHYHQLRRLVSLPAQFVGVQNSVNGEQCIFAEIIDKHSWLGNKAVHQLEIALSSVERTCTEWTRRAALACVPDLEALCLETLRDAQDWENNFKACKAYGQTVAKMTFEDEKIEWISIGTATLRREFESQTRSLWACLMSSLQASCRTDVALVDAFIANATVMLDTKEIPKNAKELANVSAKQQALREKMPEIEKTIEAVQRKGHMLRTWGGDSTTESTVKEWQKIRESMLSQQQAFENQAEIVKSSLQGEWENLNTSVESWVGRWTQAKGRLEDTQGVGRTEIIDRCCSVFDAIMNWDKFLSDRDELLKECGKFNMNIELSEIWQHGKDLVDGYVAVWTVFKEYNEEYEAIAEQSWVIFQKKLHLLDEFVSKWKVQLEPYTAITLFIQQELEKYTDLSPHMKYLRGYDFTERDWRQVFTLLEIDFRKYDALRVEDFLAVSSNIRQHIKALQKICVTASNEAAIRSALNELEIWFAGAKFTIIYYGDKTKRPTAIVKDYKEIITKIEEQQWVVSSVSGGSVSGSGGDACAAWEARLRTARTVARAAHHAQRRWLYLEPILANDDGELGLKFRKVDQGFKQASRIVEADPRLSALLQSPRLQPMLDSILEQLLACQTALNQYIDEKRSIFPRLYFLSDDDLLELLGQARAGAEGREAIMQTHLKKLFPGTTGVKLGPGEMSITALCSDHGETFQLDHPVDIDCAVEIWLKNLETEMRSSLKNAALKCAVRDSLQEQDPFSLPTQILCLAQNLRFTEQTERAIKSKELHKLKTIVERENSYYAAAEVEDDRERYKKQALVLQCAFYKSVILALIEKNVMSTDDWLWQKQLRFYLLSNKDIVAKMGLSQISYSYEYTGVTTGQFVRTVTADECFLILTQSLHLGFVGNPFGPAGTGKTESVKALGGLVGRLVLVFNCDEAMDSECMGRLLTGLARSGAWGCFDEFNRLTGDTLAAVSHQFASLLMAMHQRPAGSAPTALLNGKQVPVSEWCGVAATMNPVGRGYGGRRALPPALERVMRPVAMVQPPGDQLAAHLLAARSIPHADELAKDLNNVFKMASGLLSGQRHYDWGLRALKAAVNSCGGAMSLGDVTRHRALAAQQLALNNLSKLTAQDAQRFKNILSLVFTDVDIESSRSNILSVALEASCKGLKLIENQLQIQKCIEMYEQLKQRMGVVIVGPPGSGKTTIRRLLKTMLTQQGKNIVEYVISPKAMSRDWLLGSIDHDTRQWTDGVISATALKISNQPSDVWSWVVCDGDIDPEWVEALNSVLDDNRLLTLPSGWRIQFGANVNFIFETHTLEHASPATVSRLGIILLSDDVSCDTEILQGWAAQKVEFDDDTVKLAVVILLETVKKCLRWFTAHRSDTVVKMSNVTLVKQILTQFEYIAQTAAVNSSRVTPEDIVYLAIERSAIPILKENSVSSFRDELSSILGPPPPSPLVTCEWVTESLLMSSRLYTSDPILRSCITSDESHLLIVGPVASAKNIMAEFVLKECNSTIITINCTPVLEPADIIDKLKKSNAVRVGGSTGVARRNGTALTLFVRDIHRARRDAWGSIPVHAFLLQMLCDRFSDKLAIKSNGNLKITLFNVAPEKTFMNVKTLKHSSWKQPSREEQVIKSGGFWCRGSDEEGRSGAVWCSLHNVRVLATTVHAAVLCPRLAAALAWTAITEPDEEELLQLATNYLKQAVDKNIPLTDLTSLASRIVSMYREVTNSFDSQPHYKWTASHLKGWCDNIRWYSPSNDKELIAAISTEAAAIFKNRLVTDDDKEMFNNICKKYLKIENEFVYYASKLRSDGVYLEAVNQMEWDCRARKIINQCLSGHEYNVFGDTGAETCMELAVLSKAIAQATNGMVVVCVGSAGVGRRAAAIMSAAELSATLFYCNTHSQLTSHIKNALGVCSEGSRALLVLCEDVVSNNGGEALARIESLHRDQLSSDSDVKQNLGIVIWLDKDQEDLGELMERYPFIYNKAQLIWLEGWSDATLRDMPKLVVQRLQKENLTNGLGNELEVIPVDEFVKIYKTLDRNWTRAPCRYVNFVKTFYNIFNKKKSMLLQRQTMLSAGVEALRRARSEVATLQAEAAQQEAALSDKQTKANQALDQISATVRATTDKKEEMHELKKNIEIENERLQTKKKEIEAELASVEPVIAAARSAVGDIRSESLSEMRSLRAPPDVVRDVLEGVLRLMGIADTSWHSMKNFLSKRGVKEDIRCLDASQISPAAIESVQKLLEKRGASFEANTARRASAACAPLAAWVRANMHYGAALARVQPLQAKQAALQRNLQEAESQLSALSSGLATVDERVLALKEQLGQHTRDAAALELRLNNATQTIATARQLLDQLAHEYTAWEKDLENISKEISDLNLRSLLSAAYLVYLPDMTEPQARDCIKRWSSLVGFDDSSFSVINFLWSTEKQLQLDVDGLPADMSACKNAMFIDQYLEDNKCGLIPLLVDPDDEGLAWLKNNLADKQCDIVSQNSDKLLTTVQYAVRLNRILVITDVDAIHESWSQLLYGLPVAANVSMNTSGTRLLLHCRDESVLSRLPAHYAARVAPLHFTCRLDGLTDQLVNYALQQSNPEVNEKSKEIKIKKATLQKQQHELQENLLRDLSGNADILHDANILASLKRTRETNSTITEALEAARALELAHRAASDAYAASARRAALLTLAVKRLATRRPLLALPTDVALDIFADSIRNTPGDTPGNTRDVVKYFTRRITERVLLGLHKKDKYIVVLHLLKEVYDDIIPDKLWQYFIGNYDFIDDANTISEIKKSYNWIQDDTAKKLAKLKVTCEDLYNKILVQNSVIWKGFQESGDLNIIGKLNLSAFETLVAVRTMRPETLYRAIITFVDEVLGGGVMVSGDCIERAARLCVAGRSARRLRPVLVLAGHGADQLAAHAHKHTITQVGIEEGREAWEAAVDASRDGGWVVLIVGASPFTIDLQNFLGDFANKPVERFSEDFRLWVVCEDREIPTAVSSACINVILEAPEGVKNNIMGTLSAWGTYSAENATVRAHACLALFHALVQERRAYIPQGWSRWYAWEWGDVWASARVVRAAGAGPTARALCAALYSARPAAIGDVRVVRALHARCLSDAALSPQWRVHSLQLRLPYPTSIQEYSSAFDSIPGIDPPELLGLPANCRVAWEVNAANRIISGLQELNSVSVIKKSDDVVRLKSLLALWKKLMSGNPLLKGDYQVKKVAYAAEGWWGCVCVGECASAARSARALHATLTNYARTIARAFKTPALLHKVPVKWQLLWSGPDSLDAYIREFSYRARAAVTRIDSWDGSATFIPNEIDLRSFLHPERVIWALRARSATALQCSIDELELTVKWNCHSAAEGSEGVVVRGLMLSGCEWGERERDTEASGGGALVPAARSAPAHVPAPPLLLRTHKGTQLIVESTIEVPVYDNENRDEVIFYARAPLARTFDYDTALLNAVALFIAPVD